VIGRAVLRLRDERGFSLSEMLAVMAILAIVVGAFITVYTATIRHSTEVQDQNVLQTEVRAVVDRLAQDVRQAWTHADDTTYPNPILTASPTQVTFLSPDRGQPFHLRMVAYRVTGGSLQRAVAASTDTDGPPWQGLTLGPWANQVGSVVANPSGQAVFQYLDGNGNTAATAADVRSVIVTLTLTSKNTARPTVTFSTRATLRAENTT
jgi:prepilin-type N-terminal cleavage/methylation domain-containing protein